MEKYIVIVNQKYLVSVEAGSHGGAEHRCLDLIYGIKTAQAFSREDLRTEFFRDNAIDCETISFAELKSKAEAYKAALVYEADILLKLNNNAARIDELMEELRVLREDNGALQQHMIDAKSERKQIF